MGQYDQLLQAAITGDFEDQKALEEPFGRQIGLDPAAMEARKAATKAKYDSYADDLRKASATDEPTLDEVNVMKSIQAIEDLAKIRKKVRTGKNRT